MTTQPSALRRGRPAPGWAGASARRFTQRFGDATIDWVQAGSGPPLLLLHGYAGSARWWERNLLPLAGTHTVYALDLPGFGAARMPGPYTFERVVSLLAAWMDANRIGPATVVGHSMGGQIAMLLAAEHPDRVKSMVLLAPAGLPFRGNLFGIGRQAFLSRAGGDIRFTPIVTFGAFRAGPRILWQAVQQIRRIDVRPYLPGLTVPTLILWGERDRLIPAANAPILAAALPHAEIRIIPWMGHNIFFDDARLVNEAILTFIARFDGFEP